MSYDIKIKSIFSAMVTFILAVVLLSSPVLAELQEHNAIALLKDM